MLNPSVRTLPIRLLFFSALLFEIGCAGGGGPVQSAPAASLSVTSLSPQTVQVGSGDAILTVSGAKFSAASVAQAGGATLATTYVSASELLVVLPAAQVATAGTLPVTVTDGGVTSSAVTFTVSNPAPVITSITPFSLPPGLSSATVTLQGSGFVAGSIAQVNGAGRTTLVNSATQLSTTLSAADLASAGTLSLSVANASPGGGTSAASALSVDMASATAEPTLTDRSPATIETAAPTSTLYATGANFTSACTVLWNGQALATTLTTTSQTQPPQLLAQLPPTAVPVAGTYTMNVACPQATTAALTVTVVDPPAPQIITYTSPAIPVRTDTTFTITGSDFTSRSVAQFNGVPLSTTVTDNQHLSVIVTAAEIQTPGEYPLQVVTPGPGGGTSKPYGLTGYVALLNNDMVYNPVDGLVYVSTTADETGTHSATVVSVDPATGVIATPFSSGMALPAKLTLSSDGKDLWVAEQDQYQIAEFDMATKQLVYTNDYATYAGPTVTALAAIPGNDGAVALATYSPDYGATLQIDGPDYTLGSTIIPPLAIDALEVNGTTHEIYALAGDTYLVYTYGTNGLALKFSTQFPEGARYSSLETPTDVQLARGLLYTGTAQVFDPETGQAVRPTFLGPGLSDSGLGTPGGAMFADVAAGKIYFVPGLGYGAGSVYVFNLIDGSFITAGISVSLADNPMPSDLGAYPNRLTRWGANGLVFRNATGIYSVQSPLIGTTAAATQPQKTAQE